jgi:hypothetical protein
MPLNIWPADQLKPRQNCYQSKDPIIRTYYGNRTLTDTLPIVIQSFTADQNYAISRINMSLCGSNLGLQAVSMAWSRVPAIKPIFHPGDYNDQLILAQIVATGQAANQMAFAFDPYPVFIPAGTVLSLHGQVTANGTFIYYSTTLVLVPMFI